jgi:Hemerythrin HHE cation binding domain
MTQTLPQATHEHHARLLATLDRFPAIADALLGANPAAAQRDIVAVGTFLTATLLPHMDAAERTVYPELERMLQNRHSMAPLRREHGEVRALVSRFGTYVAELDGGALDLGRALAIRRVMFQLYALLKIHLAEEEAYIRIVEHGVPEEVGEVLAAAMAHPIG